MLALPNSPWLASERPSAFFRQPPRAERPPIPSPRTIAPVLAAAARAGAALLDRVHEVLASAGQDADDDLDLDPALAACVQRSLRGPRLAAGAPDPEPPPHTISAHGMQLHAATTVDGRDRRRLERICRYLLRPPFARPRPRAPQVPLAPRRRVRWGRPHAEASARAQASGKAAASMSARGAKRGSRAPARRSWAKMEAAAARGLTAEAWTCPSPLSLHDSGCAPRSASTCVTRPLRENMKNPAGLQRKASADKGLARPRDHCFQQ